MIRKLFHPLNILIACFLIASKLFYRHANTADLDLFLAPPSYLLRLFTGSHFTLTIDGYYFYDLNTIIDKSCSGFNLFLIYVAVGSFCFLKNKGSLIRSVLGFAVVFIASYLLTMITNFFRIYTLLNVEDPVSSVLSLPSRYIHEGIGVINNTIFLIIAYLITSYLQNKYHHEKTS